MNTSVVFADAKVKKTLEKLKTSKTEDRKLYDFLIRAFEDLEKDAFCAIQIQKNLIPKEYIRKYGKLDNLWKYDLPGGWRLMYTIKTEEVVILTIILEWLDHKDYERRFKY